MQRLHETMLSKTTHVPPPPRGDTAPTTTTATTTDPIPATMNEQDAVAELLAGLNQIRNVFGEKKRKWLAKQAEIAATPVEGPAHSSQVIDLEVKKSVLKKLWDEFVADAKDLFMPEEDTIADLNKKAREHIERLCETSEMLERGLAIEDAEHKKALELKMCEVNIEILSDLDELFETIAGHVKAAMEHKDSALWVVQKALDFAMLVALKVNVPELNLTSMEDAMGRNLVERLKSQELMAKINEWALQEAAERDHALYSVTPLATANGRRPSVAAAAAAAPSATATAAQANGWSFSLMSLWNALPSFRSTAAAPAPESPRQGR